LDAYRGFVMLAMISGGFGFTKIVRDHPEVLNDYAGTTLGKYWPQLWQTLAYQFEHVAWVGCSLWDLIQPSFMFIVGAAIPFAESRRKADGHSWIRRFLHAVLRCVILILLGVFLSSNSGPQTNFTFVNVLTQIGLGYMVVWLLCNRGWWLHLAAIVAILGGYWWWFFQYWPTPAERDDVIAYRQTINPRDGSPRDKPPEKDWDQFTGLAAHWDKHTNAAADFDRKFLNVFPRHEKPWKGKQFWVNDGGYQTLNFVPSIATMIFGLLAGQLLLRRRETPFRNFRWLLLGGVVCILVAMAVDTTIWPDALRRLIPQATWTFGPAVKRIWTPTWTVFSAGWALVILAFFYGVIDGWRLRILAFPLSVVGLNSIAIYCLAQLIKPWTAATLKFHLVAVGKAVDYDVWGRVVGDNFYGPFWESLMVLGVLWLVCVWMWWRKIFIRI
jgi:predicted acyltransferase